MIGILDFEICNLTSVSSAVYNLGFENDGQTGDLIIDFNIIFPEELDEKRKLIIDKILPKRKNQGDNTGFKQYNLTPISEKYEKY